MRFLLGASILSLAFHVSYSSVTAYESLTDLLPYKIHGWVGSFYELDDLFDPSKPQIETVVEINPWIGLTTSFIAERLPSGGKVFAIDPFEQEAPNEYIERHLPHYLPNRYEQFLSNMIRLNHTDIVTPIREKPGNAAQTEYIESIRGYRAPDLIFVNSNPGTKSVADDILHWYHRLSPTGKMCGFGAEYPQVLDSVIDASMVLGVYVEMKSQQFWCYSDPRKLPEDIKVVMYFKSLDISGWDSGIKEVSRISILSNLPGWVFGTVECVSMGELSHRMV